MTLTSKQEKFITALVEGKSQRKAYIEAGYATNGKDNNYIDKRASELFNQPQILGRYREIIDDMQKKAIWTRGQAIQDLLEVKQIALDDIRTNGIRHATQQAFNATSASLAKLTIENDLSIKKQELEIKKQELEIKLLQDKIDRSGDNSFTLQEQRIMNILGRVDEVIGRENKHGNTSD